MPLPSTLDSLDYTNIVTDLNAAWTAIGTASVDDQARATAWQNWTAYARKCQIDPWLRYQSKQSKQTYFLAFSARV
jgi:hypothetical protein